MGNNTLKEQRQRVVIVKTTRCIWGFDTLKKEMQHITFLERAGESIKIAFNLLIINILQINLSPNESAFRDTN